MLRVALPSSALSLEQTWGFVATGVSLRDGANRWGPFL